VGCGFCIAQAFNRRCKREIEIVIEVAISDTYQFADLSPRLQLPKLSHPDGAAD
jgi:hypothetical protein